MKILVADDEKGIRKSILFALSDEGHSFQEAESIAEMEDLLKHQNFDLFLLDIHFPDGSGVELFEKLRGQEWNTPTVFISGAASASEAVKAVRLGAFDYIEKPLSVDRLRTTIFRLSNHLQLQARVEALTHQPEVNLRGASTFIKKFNREVKQIAHRDFKVLITGETGTGKELIAQAIWQNSQRSQKPLITFNAAAVPDSLFESEFFGFRKGSFTGATRDQIGKAMLAHQGTLFLDEIGDLSLAAQVKILRFLDSGELQRVGSPALERSDCRILAATSKNLEAEVQAGRFRSDLYFRLNVVHVKVPPLRDRRADILPIFLEFMQNFVDKYELKAKKISPEAVHCLESYRWPGNVRELRNLAEKLAILGGNQIQVKDIEPLFQQEASFISAPSVAIGSEHRELLPLREFKMNTEAEYLRWVLQQTHGNVSEASRVLRLDRSSLHQKIKTYGLQD